MFVIYYSSKKKKNWKIQALLKFFKFLLYIYLYKYM